MLIQNQAGTIDPHYVPLVFIAMTIFKCKLCVRNFDKCSTYITSFKSDDFIQWILSPLFHRWGNPKRLSTLPTTTRWSEAERGRLRSLWLYSPLFSPLHNGKDRRGTLYVNRVINWGLVQACPSQFSLNGVNLAFCLVVVYKTIRKEKHKWYIKFVSERHPTLDFRTIRSLKWSIEWP